jgi:uncharacterized protein (TIGR03437 family)
MSLSPFCLRRYSLQQRMLFIAATFLIAPSLVQAQNFAWVRQFGTDRDEQVNAVAASASGVYVGGNTIGVFPGEASAGLNDVDAFVARFDNAGNRLWVRQFGSTAVAADYVYGVAADSTGVYAVGTTRGALPGQTPTGSSDIFVRKYDLNGNIVWTRQLGTPQEDQGLAAAIDATGVYVAGAQFADGFLRKYDFNGNELWTRLVSTTSGDEVRGVAADTSGVYVTGRTNGEIVPPKPGVADFDTFVRKYDKDGNVIWTRQFGTIANEQGNAIAVNSTGVYLAGDTTGTFAGQTKAGGLWDMFAAKFDLNGTQQWVRQFGCAYEDGAYGVALSAAGAYVVGYAEEALPGSTAVGNLDDFVRVYDTNGSIVSTSMFGVINNDGGALGVAADATGVYIGGQTGHGTAFQGQTTFGSTDGFIARIPPPPDVSVGGVVNNGSFAPNPAPLAPGAIAAVFGSNLNDGTIQLSSSFGGDGKLITALGGTSVTINGTAAPIFYSTMGQIGIQIPYEVAGQSTAQIVVSVAGQSSVARTFNIAPSAPGIFTANQQGTGIAAVLHQDGVSPITPQNPAHPDEVIIFFLTGLGALSPSVATGAPSGGNLSATATLTIDGVSAAVDYAGGAPGFVGLNQINARVPANTRTAEAIPVIVSIGGRASNTATVPVAP